MNTRTYKEINLRVKKTRSNQLELNAISQYIKPTTYKRRLQQRQIDNSTNSVRYSLQKRK
jgi:hypothetical protein